jgi:hypothetical protein
MKVIPYKSGTPNAALTYTAVENDKFIMVSGLWFEPSAQQIKIANENQNKVHVAYQSRNGLAITKIGNDYKIDWSAIAGSVALTANNSLVVEIDQPSKEDSIITKSDAIKTVVDLIKTAADSIYTYLTTTLVNKIDAIQTSVNAINAIPTGTIIRTVNAGFPCVFYPTENGLMTTFSGATVTQTTLDGSVVSLPFAFQAWQKIIIDTSNTPPFTLTAIYNKVTSSKTSTQDVAQSSNPTPGIGFAYDGVYDATNTRWVYLRNIGSLISSAYLELVDSNGKLIKALLGSRNTFMSLPSMQIAGSFIYTFGSSTIYAMNVSTNVLTTISFAPNGLYKFTNNNGITKIVAVGTGAVMVINPLDNSYTNITLPSGAQYRHAVFCAAINRIAISAVSIGRVAFIDIEGNALDGSEINTTQPTVYLAVSANGLKLHCTLTTTATYDDIVIDAIPANRIKTNISISQLTSGQQGFVYEYGSLIYFWLLANTIVAVNSSNSTYNKTISGVNGNQFGLLVDGSIYCANMQGSGNGYVSKFNLATEAVTNTAVNNIPTILCYNPITNKIHVGCQDATNGLSVI